MSTAFFASVSGNVTESSENMGKISERISRNILGRSEGKLERSRDFTN
jgi:hypothetical protein